MSRVSQNLVLIPALLVAVTLALVAEPQARAEGVVEHELVGAERCRACHEKQYDIWSKGPLARAMDRLSERERKDPRCIQCHTMAPDVPDPALVGIQCETCHGPGKWYSKDHVMRDRELRAALRFAVPDEKTCERCHTANTPAVRPFSYAEKLERIRHWD